MPRRYRTLMFDLFNTVALWLPDRMPRWKIRGELRISTLGELRAVLAAHETAPAFDRFATALEDVNALLARERSDSGREIPSRLRFGRTLEAAGMAPGAQRDDLAAALSHRHMALLAAGCEVPHAHRALLALLERDYEIVLVSNFDHADTARRILRRDGIHDLFAHVVVSEETGWRKPSPQIFDHALSLSAATTTQVLFIGDSAEEDIAGAARAGFDTAWINRADETLSTATQPTYELAKLTELETLLD